MIKNLLSEEEENVNGLMSHWEWIKFDIKSRSIQFSKERKHEWDQHENSLTEEYRKAKLEADQGLLEDGEKLKSLSLKA